MEHASFREGVVPNLVNSDQSQISMRISSRIFYEMIGVVECDWIKQQLSTSETLSRWWLFWGAGSVAGFSPTKKNHGINYIYIYIAIATGILVFSFSHSLSHLDGFFRIFLGFCCNSKREVLDHEVYLQGAPFGRDLIHWDRQFFDGFLVRLLTVLAAWVWGPRGHMDPRVGDVVMCGLSFGMFWACLGFRIFRAVSNPGYSKHRLAPKFR